MDEKKIISFVVEGWHDSQMEVRTFNSFSEAQDHIDHCLEEEKYSKLDLFRETHTRQLLSNTCR